MRNVWSNDALLEFETGWPRKRKRKRKRTRIRRVWPLSRCNLDCSAETILRSIFFSKILITEFSYRFSWKYSSNTESPKRDSEIRWLSGSLSLLFAPVNQSGYSIGNRGTTRRLTNRVWTPSAIVSTSRSPS